MAKISEIMADMEKVEKGRWVNYAADIKLLVAGINNSQYREARQRLLKPHQHSIRTGLLGAEQLMDMLKPTAAKYLLLDWTNLEDENGQAIPYSPEQALKFFKDKAFADLYSFVLEMAGESELFRKQEFEDSLKNSVNASDGN